MPNIFRGRNVSLKQPANFPTAAAIVGQDTVVWAQSPSFPQLKALEIEGIVKDFEVPGSLAPTGLYLGGIKYMATQGENGAAIRDRRKDVGGITIKKTNQSLAIGIYGFGPLDIAGQ